MPCVVRRQAIATMDRALAADPSNLDVLVSCRCQPHVNANIERCCFPHRQAIAAMDRALAADPSNLDVLLSLGVSHTNELDQGEAVTYLSRWLALNPAYADIAASFGPPPDESQLQSHTTRAFEAAAAAHQQASSFFVAATYISCRGTNLPLFQLTRYAKRLAGCVCVWGGAFKKQHCACGPFGGQRQTRVQPQSHTTLLRNNMAKANS